MRLWELEAGDGADVGIGYVGGVQPHEPQVVEIIPDDAVGELGEVDLDGPGVANRAGDVLDRAEAGAADRPPHRGQVDGIDEGAARDPLEVQQRAPAAPDLQPAPPAQELQREGPLVLRINAPQPAPVVRAVPDAPQLDRRQRGRQRRNRNRRVEPRQEPIRQPGPRGGGAVRMQPVRPIGRGPAREDGVVQAREAVDQEWVQRFVQLALNDEEDQIEWDSDDEDAAAWEIPVR